MASQDKQSGKGSKVLRKLEKKRRRLQKKQRKLQKKLDALEQKLRDARSQPGKATDDEDDAPPKRKRPSAKSKPKKKVKPRTKAASTVADAETWNPNVDAEGADLG